MDMGAAGRKKLTPEHKRNISLGLRRNKDSLGLRPYNDTTWEHYESSSNNHQRIVS